MKGPIERESSSYSTPKCASVQSSGHVITGGGQELIGQEVIGQEVIGQEVIGQEVIGQEVIGHVSQWTCVPEVVGSSPT